MARVTLLAEPAAAVLNTAADAAGPFADWVQAPDTRGRPGWQRPDAPVPRLAWEDLPAWSDSTPADPAAGPCHWCGWRQWWLSIHGAVVCGHCPPPATPELVKQWLDPKTN